MNLENIKNLFYDELKSDRNFMESIWINYPEDRIIREKTALNQFIKLYSGNIEDTLETNTKLQESLKILDKFAKHSQKDIVLTKRLIQNFFNQIKELYSENKISIIHKDLNYLKELIEYIGIEKINLKQKKIEKLKKLYSSKNSLKKIVLEELDIEELEKLKLEFLNSKEKTYYFKDMEKESFEKAKLELNEIIEQKKQWNEILKKLDKEYEVYYEKIEELRKIWGDNSLTASLGWDLSSTNFSEENLFKLKKTEKFLEVEDNKILNELMSLLGNSYKKKKKLSKKSLRKGISTTSKNELLGVHNSSDLARVLPSELSYLNNKYLKYRFYLNYVESQLNTYLVADNSEENTDKNNKNSEGPFIACVDTSSSMEGQPEIISKSVIIKLIKIAKKQKRKIYLIIFGSIGELEEFEINYRNINTKKLYEFLNYTFYGGTDFVTPIKRSIELIETKKYRKADILMISDGVAKVPDKFIEKINYSKKKYKFDIYSLIIGNENIQDKFSDQIFYYHHKQQEKMLDRSFTRRDVSFYADDVTLFID